MIEQPHINPGDDAGGPNSATVDRVPDTPRAQDTGGGHGGYGESWPGERPWPGEYH